MNERQIYLKCDNGFEATVRDNDQLKNTIIYLNQHQGLSQSSYYTFRGDVGFGFEVNSLINELIHAPIVRLCDEVFELGRKIRELKGLHELDKVVKELNLC